MTEEDIKNKLETFFQSRDEIPLFYIESGSRLWNFASPDSDFDVRGFHLQLRERYFDFRRHRDIIEVMDGDFDLVSYDIDKMFGLLATSNPTVFEWIRAHICYANILPDWKTLQKEIVDNYDFQALYYHYLSLAKVQLHDMEKGNKFTYKKVFYCIRGLLSSDLATQKIIPPLDVEQLLDLMDASNPLVEIARNSLVQKRTGGEKLQVEALNQQKVLSVIHPYMEELSARKSDKRSDNARLTNILTEYCIYLKTECYSQ